MSARRQLPPEENKRSRTKGALHKRGDKVNKRIASRLVRWGWSVTDPNGHPWTEEITEEEELATPWWAYK